MIAKNIKGKSFKGCVSYVMHEGATLLEAEGVWAETKQDMIRSFAMQRFGRKEVKQPVGHIPIAFSSEDKNRMTDEFMVKLAKEYMEEMGIRNTQYIIVRHNNTENPHLHIVYNRINNDLILISVNHDYKRNIKVCKKLKDKYGLTYGSGKEKVNREKLNNPDKVKYYIHDSIKSVLPACKNAFDLRLALEKLGIEIEYKHKRTSNEIEGVSFMYHDVAFKGSEVDRKYSFGNLKKEFLKNILDEDRRMEEKYQEERKDAEQKQQQTGQRSQPDKQNLVILGVELTPCQEKKLRSGNSIYLENMVNPKDGSIFSAYALIDKNENKVLFFHKNPDAFVQYGKYEMRDRDRQSIKAGNITRAKVKLEGVNNFVYPYLWKENNADVEYKESWDDPRLPKTLKEEKKIESPTVQKKSRGRKM